MWNSVVDYGAIGNSLKDGVAWSLWEQIHNNQTACCRNKHPIWLEILGFFLLHWNGAVHCSGAIGSKMNTWNTQHTWVFSSSCFWIQPWAKKKKKGRCLLLFHKHQLILKISLSVGWKKNDHFYCLLLFIMFPFLLGFLKIFWLLKDFYFFSWTLCCFASFYHIPYISSDIL